MIIHDGGKIALGAITEAARLEKMNIPYLWGGNSERGFDCSGYVQWCYAVGGYPGIPKDRRVWTTATLRLIGDSVPKGSEQPGDLIFPDLGHVGIFLNGHVFSDAPETGKFVGEHDFTHYNGGAYQVVRIADPVSGTFPTLNSTPGLIAQILSGGLVSGGLTVDPAITAVNTALQPLEDFFASFNAPIAWLSDGNNWIRIGMIAGGAALLLFGIVYLEESS